jgi:hypothetical protein
MKFLLIVFVLHVIGELINNKRKDSKLDEAEVNENVRHPAEFDLR